MYVSIAHVFRFEMMHIPHQRASTCIRHCINFRSGEAANKQAENRAPNQRQRPQARDKAGKSTAPLAAFREL
uniref:Conserved domain protein n=1 Tax=Ascaris lumbricoides TaxID=6252 RepID=A0A0M3HW50_ASCLU